MSFLTPEQIEETHALLQGKKEMPRNLDKLAKWASAKYDVDVLNIVLDRVEIGGADPRSFPRLDLIVRDHFQEQKFRDEYNYNSDIQNEIARKFRSIMGEVLQDCFDDLLVITSSFAYEAFYRLYNSVSENEIAPILKIHDAFVDARTVSGLYVLFDSEELVGDEPDQILQDKVRDHWASILSKCDKHSFFSNERLRASVYFYSKQKFDQVYQGNWAYFYKDH